MKMTQTTLPTITVEATPKSKLTRVQIKYLRDRVTAQYYSRHDTPKEREPPEVRAARAVVKRWDHRHEVRDRRRHRLFNRAQQRATDAILFLTPGRALAAVRAFEQLCRKE